MPTGGGGKGPPHLPFPKSVSQGMARFSSVPMSPQQAIAHDRIVSKLGEGGMGAVYRAADTKLNRDVAINASSAEPRSSPPETSQHRRHLRRRAERHRTFILNFFDEIQRRVP